MASRNLSGRLRRPVHQGRAPRVAGRAALIIRCVRQAAEPILYLHQPASGTHVPVIYRFDDKQPETRMAPILQDGRVLQIWKEEENKQDFAHSKRLRVQLRPFVVFDLRGTDRLPACPNCLISCLVIGGGIGAMSPEEFAAHVADILRQASVDGIAGLLPLEKWEAKGAAVLINLADGTRFDIFVRRHWSDQ
jgi:hypothetical protein